MSARTSYVLAVMVLVPACIADEADAWIPTDIDVNATIEQIGEQSRKLVCDQFESSVHRIYRSPLLIQAACTVHAIRQARDAEECVTLTDQCLGTLPAVVDAQLEDILGQAGCQAIGADRKGCRSTVSELISCLGDLGDAVGNVKQELTCAAFGSPVPDDWWKVAPPVTCVDLVSQCHGP